MNERDASIKSLAGINALFGAWLIISPFLLSYTTNQARWNSTIAGAVVLILAAVRYFAPSQNWASWLIALTGLWMIIAPFAVDYSATVAYWNQVIFGILITVTGLANAATHASSEHAGRRHSAM